MQSLCRCPQTGLNQQATVCIANYRVMKVSPNQKIDLCTITSWCIHTDIVVSSSLRLCSCKSSSGTGEEGDLFEGDIRLRPGEDPYDILRAYRHRAKRTIMQDSGQDEDPNLLNETTTPGNSRLWPNNIVPFKYKPELGMSFGDTHWCASTTFDSNTRQFFML